MQIIILCLYIAVGFFRPSVAEIDVGVNARVQPSSLSLISSLGPAPFGTASHQDSIMSPGKVKVKV